MTERRRLVREPGTAHPRSGRLERAGREEVEERGPAPGGERGEGGEQRRGRRGRAPLMADVNDLNRGVIFAGVETAAVALDVVSRVLRGVVDRAFDEDYNTSGDIIRGLASETDTAAYDLVGEMRHIPRRLAHRFEEAARSPRADLGERRRRADAGATTPADSPAAGRGEGNGA